MRFLRLVALSAALLLVAGLLSNPSVAEAASKKPSAVTKVTASPGASPGTVTFRWKSAGKRTDYFVLETALSSFSKSAKSSLPKSGRHARKFKISAKSRSWTMSAAQAKSAGAPLGSANYLYYRFTAVNKVGKKTYTKAYPKLQIVMPKEPVAGSKSAKSSNASSTTSTGTGVRVATFNLLTAQLGKGSRSWLNRVDDVAADILSTGAGVVLLQETSPGRADGVNAPIGNVGRQTTTLVDQLKKQGGSKYDYTMVRTTSYVNWNLPSGTQGTRILYDNKRFKLLSDCPEYTGKDSYHSSCSFALPILSGDSESKRRRGNYALLQDRSTGQQFWAVSAHLDERHSSNKKTGARYDQLRGNQARSIVTLVNKVNTKNYPVVLGADINTWQNDRSGYSGHDALVAGGFYDTKASASRTNVAYTTVNEFKTRLTKHSSGLGSHLDVVMVKGGRGSADRWVNLMKNPDATRASDHNLVYADITI